jgi:hypothetical protein
MDLSYWLRIEGKLEDREMGWEEKTPLTKEFFEAAGELAVARSECSEIIEERDPDRPAPKRYGLWEAVFLSRLPYPNPLPELPEIYKEVTIATGDDIPFSGIWEPMKDGKLGGAMNYLHGGSYAPTYRETNLLPSDRDYGFKAHTVNTVWRLIWRDDRYEDGKIPEEEKSYIFLYPPQTDFLKEEHQLNPLQYIRKHDIEHPFLDRKRPPWGRCDGGGQCPKEGWWTSHAAPDRIGRRYFKQGEIMPNFPHSTWGATIWYLEDPWGERQKK